MNLRVRFCIEVNSFKLGLIRFEFVFYTFYNALPMIYFFRMLNCVSLKLFPIANV